jgi:DNA-directed RNA polymerase subunit RPC12/RpoP
MVKKLKVVDVAQTEEASRVEEPAVEETIVEEPIQEISEEPIKVITEEIKPTEEVKPDKKPKTIQEIVCEHCNKKMLMKTYKYSHQKVCKANVQELPAPTPQPPPTKEPTKPPKAIPKKQPEPTDKESTASFNAYSEPAQHENTYLREWNDLRQHRQMVRQQRVKSLISQAI